MAVSYHSDGRSVSVRRVDHLEAGHLFFPPQPGENTFVHFEQRQDHDQNTQGQEGPPDRVTQDRTRDHRADPGFDRHRSPSGFHLLTTKRAAKVKPVSQERGPEAVASTRDQLEAYTYEGRRQVTSLMVGSDEAIADPRRRINRVTIGSVVIAILVMAGFGIAGFLGGGRGPDLPESGAVLLKGSGDRYVVVDGRVHPALNLASALLTGGGTLTEVRQRALDTKPRGLPIGIPGAPDALPTKQQLTNGPWTMCVVPSQSMSVPPAVTLVIGDPAPAEGVLGKNAGTIVQDPAQQHWLIAHGRRFKFTGNSQVVLGLQRASAARIPAEALNTIPQGPDLAEPALPDGRDRAPSFTLPVSAATGDVAQADGQHFVVQSDGLSPISEPAFLLLAAGGSRKLTLPSAAVFSAPQSKRPVPDQRGWPDEVPEVTDLERDHPLCVSTTPGEPAGDAAWQVRVSAPPSVPRRTPVGSKSGDVPGIVSEVVIAPGTGALVRGTSAAGQDGVYTLVTDAGQRYPSAHRGRCTPAPVRPGRNQERAVAVRVAAPGRPGARPGRGRQGIHRNELVPGPGNDPGLQIAGQGRDLAHRSIATHTGDHHGIRGDPHGEHKRVAQNTDAVDSAGVVAESAAEITSELCGGHGRPMQLRSHPIGTERPRLEPGDALRTRIGHVLPQRHGEIARVDPSGSAGRVQQHAAALDLLCRWQNLGTGQPLAIRLCPAAKPAEAERNTGRGRPADCPIGMDRWSAW